VVGVGVGVEVEALAEEGEEIYILFHPATQ